MKVPKHLKRRRLLRQRAIENQYQVVQNILDHISNEQGCTLQEWEIVKHLFNKDTVTTPIKKEEEDEQQ